MENNVSYGPMMEDSIMVKKIVVPVLFITAFLLNSNICSMQRVLRIGNLLRKVEKGEKMDVCKADRFGNTLLHYACMYDSNEYLKAVLSQGGARVINKVNNDGESPLDIACSKHNLEMVKILLEHGTIIRKEHIDVSSNEHIKALMEKILFFDKNDDLTQKKIENSYFGTVGSCIAGYKLETILLKRSLYKSAREILEMSKKIEDIPLFKLFLDSQYNKKINYEPKTKKRIGMMQTIIQADPYLKLLVQNALKRRKDFSEKLQSAGKFKNCRILCH